MHVRQAEVLRHNSQLSFNLLAFKTAQREEIALGRICTFRLFTRKHADLSVPHSALQSLMRSEENWKTKKQSSLSVRLTCYLARHLDLALSLVEKTPHSWKL